jgi:hypothetical protein
MRRTFFRSCPLPVTWLPVTSGHVTSDQACAVVRSPSNMTLSVPIYYCLGNAYMYFTIFSRPFFRTFFPYLFIYYIFSRNFFQRFFPRNFFTYFLPSTFPRYCATSVAHAQNILPIMSSSGHVTSGHFRSRHFWSSKTGILFSNISSVS